MSYRDSPKTLDYIDHLEVEASDANRRIATLESNVRMYKYENAHLKSQLKDLGILKDGLLPCPFCEEYPTLKEELDENDERIYAIEHECNIYMTTGWYHDKQIVIDAWNRRV